VNQKKLIIGLAAVCGTIWVIAALRPLDRQAWLLENLLLVIFIIVLLFTHRRLQLSATSYGLIALFIVLHIVGAHYTYGQMPLGFWMKNLFGFGRNNADRVIHFAFGFLLVFPVRELIVRFGGIRRAWSYWLSIAVILAVSGLFEILESIVAEIVAPGKGVDWLGSQGDEWDAQNDMISAMSGALLMMGLVALMNRKKAA
jgi:putative membrane protein